MVNFVLGHLDDNLFMDLSGSMEAASVSIADASACAVFQLNVADLKNVFKFQSDAFDVENAAATDVKYYVNHAAWPIGVNVAHAMMQGTAATGASGAMTAEGGSYDDNRNLLKHDFVRYLSKKLFNTIFGVDLFQNENELLANIVGHGDAIKGRIVTKLATVGVDGSDNQLSGDAGSKHFTNAVTDSKNLCRVIMLQLASTQAGRERFKTMDASSGIQSVPFEENDALYFKVTVKAANDQHLLTNVSLIDERTYNIKLLLKPNPVTNTDVTDSAVHVPNFPYDVRT